MVSPNAEVDIAMIRESQHDLDLLNKILINNEVGVLAWIV